jgi:triacylglycerol lipase
MSKHMFGAALLLALALPAAAQTAGPPAEVWEKVSKLGPVINPPETAKIYAPLHEKEPYQGIKVVRDIKFGADAERQALDVLVADAATAKARPVLIFVHGGGFVRGARRTPGTPFYDNVVLFAARNGMVGVNTTYRLAPKHPWPTGAEDVAAAVRWVGENIAGYGGDPTRVFLMGHSAGAVHVASYVAHPEFHGPKGIGLAGAILVSGLYDLTVRPPGPNEKIYFGEDTSKHAARSSLKGLVQSKLPLLVVAGEIDPPMFREDARLLNDARCKAGRCPRYLMLAKHSHMSETYAINTKDTSFSGEILAFVAKE